MRTDSGVIRYSTKADYLKKSSLKGASDATKKAASDLATKPSVDDLKENLQKSVDISDEAKAKAKKNVNEALKQSVDNAKTSFGRESLVSAVRAGVGIAEKAGRAALKTINRPPVPNVNLTGAERLKSIEALKENKPVNKPAIIFISGLQVMGISSNDGGVQKMSEHVRDAQHFDWHQEDEIIKEISKRPIHQPIIMIGHSLGGDTAVSIANRLNSLEHQFRKVDFLVTMDSVGYDNDIIPHNVTKNLNFIGDSDMLINDGPNIARDTKVTEVINELRDESHTGLDEAKDVQFKIINGINEAIALRFVENTKNTVKELYKY